MLISGRLNNLAFRVGYSDTLTDNPALFKYIEDLDGEFGKGKTWTLSFDGVIGCVVSIHKRGIGYESKLWPLTLCEVEVYGEGKSCY